MRIFLGGSPRLSPTREVIFAKVRKNAFFRCKRGQGTGRQHILVFFNDKVPCFGIKPDRRSRASVMAEPRRSSSLRSELDDVRDVAQEMVCHSQPRDPLHFPAALPPINPPPSYLSYLQSRASSTEKASSPSKPVKPLFAPRKKVNASGDGYAM